MKCVNCLDPSSGDLRLAGSSSLTGGSSGRLEIYYSGQWGTVCDDSFGSSDARVACRQLGYSTSSTPRYGTVGALGYVSLYILICISLTDLPLNHPSVLLYCVEFQWKNIIYIQLVYRIISPYSFSRPSSFTRIWLDNLRCSGFESRLINCPANAIGDQDCTHFEDIALSCTGSSKSQ